MRALSVGVEREAGDRPRVRPTERAIQAFRIGPALRVERQQPEPGRTCRILRSEHECSSQALAARPAVHDQFRDLRAVRLVGRPRGNDLHGTDELSLLVASNKDDAARVGTREEAGPPLERVVDRQWREKTDCRAGIDGIDEKARKRKQILTTRWRVEGLDLRHGAKGYLRTISRAVIGYHSVIAARTWEGPADEALQEAVRYVTEALGTLLENHAVVCALQLLMEIAASGHPEALSSEVAENIRARIEGNGR